MNLLEAAPLDSSAFWIATVVACLVAFTFPYVDYAIIPVFREPCWLVEPQEGQEILIRHIADEGDLLCRRIRGGLLASDWEVVKAALPVPRWLS